MESLGKPVPWTKDAIITPKGVTFNNSCVLNFRGPQYIGVADAHQRRGFLLETADTIAAEVVARFLSCSYVWLWAPKTSGGTPLPNGTWTGVLGGLHRGHQDMLFTQHVILLPRYMAFHFARTFSVHHLITILCTEITEHFAFSIFTLATSDIWILILISYLTVALILSARPLSKKKIRLDLFGSRLFDSWGTLVGQPRKIKRCTLFIIWVFACRITFQAIFGEMGSIMAVPSSFSVSSLEDLAFNH